MVTVLEKEEGHEVKEAVSEGLPGLLTMVQGWEKVTTPVQLSLALNEVVTEVTLQELFDRPLQSKTREI